MLSNMLIFLRNNKMEELEMKDRTKVANLARDFYCLKIFQYYQKFTNFSESFSTKSPKILDQNISCN